MPGKQEGIFNFNAYEETRTKDGEGTTTQDGTQALRDSGAHDRQKADVARRNKEKLDRLFGEAGPEGQAVTRSTISAIEPRQMTEEEFTTPVPFPDLRIAKPPAREDSTQSSTNKAINATPKP